MKQAFTLVLAAAATFAAASPVQAAKVAPPPPSLPAISPACAVSDVAPTASACVGWYTGNLLGGSQDKRDLAKAALALLGFAWTPNTLVNTIERLSTDTDPSQIYGHTIDFTGVLSGKTVIGIHRGGANNGTQGTAFFLWNNIAKTDKITLNLGGLSNSTLFLTTFSVVPEPATWMLMIAGVGLVGWQLRRRRQTVKVSYA